MARIRFVGDIHGKFDAYHQVVGSAEQSIQVGDFGYGFHNQWDSSVQAWQKLNPQHRFIRGNHDCLAVCALSPTWITDGQVEGQMMFMGGAWSIDHAWRTPGVNWWADEELTHSGLERMIDIYSQTRPDVMVTHDCPLSVSWEMFIKAGSSVSNTQIHTRTGAALDAMFQVHQPRIWIFGHWHVSKVQVINGTKFVCLGELDHIDLDMETLAF